MILENTYLRRLDELFVHSHRDLTEKDEVYYLGEYTTGGKYSYSEMNQLILNYKIETKHRGSSRWHHKEDAIKNAVAMWKLRIMQNTGLRERFHRALLVPIPPSKDDDRNVQLVRYLGRYEELIVQSVSRESLHGGKQQRDPKQLPFVLTKQTLPEDVQEIWLFDDTVVSGSTLRAASDLILRDFPKMRVASFVLARAISPTQTS